MEFKIRDCVDNDYSFVHDLLKENMLPLYEKYWGGFDEEVFKKDFNKENIKIVEHGDSLVAYYDLEFNDDYSFVKNVQVSNSMQGLGLGTFMMGLIEKETKSHGFSRVRLRVFKENIAKGLYDRLGFKEIVDEGKTIVMEKVLD